MDYDISALKVLFKKIFPPKKSIFTVDTTGDGNADSLLIKAFNVVMAIEIPPEIELGGFSSKDFNLKRFDIKDYGKLYIDEIPVTIAENEFNIETIKNHFMIFHKGVSFTIDDLLAGNLAGRIIALGDTINILIRIKSEGIKKFTKGKHKLIFESKLIPKLEFDFELDDSNLNIGFHPEEL